jgi:thymidylate kinase
VRSRLRSGVLRIAVGTVRERPLKGSFMIIEFAGLPKSGKSSNIGVVRDYFSRSGHKTRLVAEGARNCPFPNKKRVEFACWTANQSLNSVLEVKYAEDDDVIVIQDRGLFDALAFIKLLSIEEFIDKDSETNLCEYFADPRWTTLVDIVILFSINPERAIDRDIAAQLNAPPGVITNAITMRKLSTAYEQVLADHGTKFRRVERIDTTHLSPQEAAQKVIAIIQTSLQP